MTDEDCESTLLERKQSLFSYLLLRRDSNGSLKQRIVGPELRMYIVLFDWCSLYVIGKQLFLSLCIMN